MQKRILEKLKADPRIKRLAACLNKAESNLVEAGKIILKLRETLPNCDQVLLELFPQQLTPHRLARLCMCGKGEIIPDFISVPGTLGKKLTALPLDLQKKIYSEGVDVVIGGTAAKPVSKRYTWTELQPSHAAQVFDGPKIRSLKEQVSYRVKKVKAIAPPYTVTKEGLRVRGYLIPWLTLDRLVKENSPLTGASRAEASAQAAVV